MTMGTGETAHAPRELQQQQSSSFAVSGTLAEDNCSGADECGDEGINPHTGRAPTAGFATAGTGETRAADDHPGMNDHGDWRNSTCIKGATAATATVDWGTTGGE